MSKATALGVLDSDSEFHLTNLPVPLAVPCVASQVPETR